MKRLKADYLDLTLRSLFRRQLGVQEGSLEKAIYEMKPWLFLGVSTLAVFNQQRSLLMIFSGMLLLFCAGRIIAWRVYHRRNHRLN